MTTTTADAAARSTERKAGLTIRAMAGVLLGRRNAILAAAGDRATLWIGLILVAAAALAREYDAHDLAREPWHLALPFAASLALSLVTFLLLRRRDPPRPFWPEYRGFLGLFLLAAPPALLYAIPYERFLSPASAMRANLWTLGLVAAWRIVLLMRIAHVFLGRSRWASFWIAMLFADAAAAIALLAVPTPVLQLMGGIRLTEAEMMLQGTVYWGRFLSIATLLIWLIGAAASANSDKQHPQPPFTAPASRGFPWTAAAIAVALVVMWAPILPKTQSEQRLAGRAEQLLRDGKLSDALTEMSEHTRGDYPPGWDPPPRIGWPELEKPAILDVMDVLVQQGAGQWVRQICIDKFERRCLGYNLRWEQELWPRVQRLLEQLPEAPALNQRNADVIETVRYHHERSTPASSPTTGESP